jgi:hypothetical protein
MENPLSKTEKFAQEKRKIRSEKWKNPLSKKGNSAHYNRKIRSLKM